MQHNRAGRKLRRTTSHRLAMFSNQLASLMTHERIQTTLSKAKELRPAGGAAHHRGQERRRRGAPPGRPAGSRTAPRSRRSSRRSRRASWTGRADTRGSCGWAPARATPPRRRSWSSWTTSSRRRRRRPARSPWLDRARRASGGRVETVRKEKPEGGEGEERREPRKPPRKAAGAQGREGQAGGQARAQEGPVAHGSVQARRLRSLVRPDSIRAPRRSGALSFFGMSRRDRRVLSPGPRCGRGRLGPLPPRADLVAVAARGPGRLCDPGLRQARPRVALRRRGLPALLRRRLARRRPRLAWLRALAVARRARRLGDARRDPPGLDPGPLDGGAGRARPTRSAGFSGARGGARRAVERPGAALLLLDPDVLAGGQVLERPGRSPRASRSSAFRTDFSLAEAEEHARVRGGEVARAGLRRGG